MIMGCCWCLPGMNICLPVNQDIAELQSAAHMLTCYGTYTVRSMHVGFMDTVAHTHEHLKQTDLCSIIGKGGFVQGCVRKVNTLDLGVLNAIHL